MNLNLGCGPYKEPNHINIDINPLHKPDVVRDITKGLPYSNDCIQSVRASHVFEHLIYEDIIFVLNECFRVLTPGGLLDIFVPLGITGDLDHKSVFMDYSFDVLLRKESREYFNTNMRWKEDSREEFPEGNNYKVFHIKLRAIK